MADFITTSTSDGGETNIQGSGNLLIAGNITAYYSSDITLKDNVRPIENALFKVKQLSGIHFTWNEKAEQAEQEKGEDVGLIAQDVQKVLPEIVQIRKNGTLAIQYEKVVPLLVEAIKDQQKQIEELKSVSLGYKKLLDAKEKHLVKKQRENEIKEKLKKDGLVISKYGK